MSNFPESGFPAHPEIGFAPLVPEHLTLLHSWLQQPHVRVFWDDGCRTPEQVRAHYFALDRDAECFVVTLGGRPIGFLQTHPVGPEAEYARWRSTHGETWGMDLLLGDPADTGRGLGPQVIRAVLRLWLRQRPALRRMLIDPDVRNARALKACQKAGFSALGEHLFSSGSLPLLALDF